jgi:hypothetical protein
MFREEIKSEKVFFEKLKQLKANALFLEVENDQKKMEAKYSFTWMQYVYSYVIDYNGESEEKLLEDLRKKDIGKKIKVFNAKLEESVWSRVAIVIDSNNSQAVFKDFLEFVKNELKSPNRMNPFVSKGRLAIRFKESDVDYLISIDKKIINEDKLSELLHEKGISESSTICWIDTKMKEAEFALDNLQPLVAPKRLKRPWYKLKSF